MKNSFILAFVALQISSGGDNTPPSDTLLNPLASIAGTQKVTVHKAGLYENDSQTLDRHDLKDLNLCETSECLAQSLSCSSLKMYKADSDTMSSTSGFHTFDIESSTYQSKYEEYAKSISDIFTASYEKHNDVGIDISCDEDTKLSAAYMYYTQYLKDMYDRVTEDLELDILKIGQQFRKIIKEPQSLIQKNEQLNRIAIYNDEVNTFKNFVHIQSELLIREQLINYEKLSYQELIMRIQIVNSAQSFANCATLQQAEFVQAFNIQKEQNQFMSILYIVMNEEKMRIIVNQEKNQDFVFIENEFKLANTQEMHTRNTNSMIMKMMNMLTYKDRQIAQLSDKLTEQHKFIQFNESEIDKHKKQLEITNQQIAESRDEFDEKLQEMENHNAQEITALKEANTALQKELTKQSELTEQIRPKGDLSINATNIHISNCDVKDLKHMPVGSLQIVANDLSILLHNGNSVIYAK
ncbi:hypothetical protein [Candidatus Cytomitobacter primus]|uniref:Uncharacterized protein n=1 Tax=Candidatus Cytomitobacter primus TaxID=2066024 RepID=A0A5C0UGU2_9PROT|nr:hypothetical protein [Candidatus Cytomitobacter primus]QEK38763.1 hypothetical protein FZC34_02510 [Candidatus Cytomitobacter primus]